MSPSNHFLAQRYELFTKKYQLLKYFQDCPPKWNLNVTLALLR